MANSLAKRVLFVFLNTGGGHRSTAQAAAEALQDLYGDRVRVDLVDATGEYFSWPASELDTAYRHLVRLRAWPWAVLYRLTDGARRAALLRRGWLSLTSRSVRELLDDHPADVVVCCHPLLKASTAEAVTASGQDTRLITLVTDLAAAHAWWFVPRGDRYLVATEAARERATAYGIPAECVQISGLPVKRCFLCGPQRRPRWARRELGLMEGVPLVLVVGGANGMGPLMELVTAVVSTGVRAQLAVVTGSNTRAREMLSSRTWSLPVYVEGFAANLHEWMRAADILVTKAGPSTLSEALVMGLPMVLSGALPGQERPNVDFVVDSGAGLWAPTAAKAGRVVKELLESQPSRLEEMEKSARCLAQPEAARRAARGIWATACQTLA